MEATEQKTVTRNDLEKLVGVPAVTIYSWWQKGFITPPATVGDRSHGARFTLTETFAISAFAVAVRESNRQLWEAAPVAAYILARPGVAQAITNEWRNSVAMTVYPTYDVVGLTAPPDWIERRAIAGSEACLKAEAEGRNASALDLFWRETYLLEKYRAANVEMKSIDIGIHAERILRSYKAFQNAWPEAPTAYLEFFRGWLPREVSLMDRLLGEAWAIRNIEAAVAISPFENRRFPQRSAPYSINVSDAAGRVIQAFQRL